MRLFQQTTTSHITLDPDLVNLVLYTTFCTVTTVVLLKTSIWPQHRPGNVPIRPDQQDHVVSVPNNPHDNIPQENGAQHNNIQQNEVPANPNPARRQPARQPRRALPRRAAAVRRNEEDAEQNDDQVLHPQAGPGQAPRQARWSLQTSMSFPM